MLIFLDDDINRINEFKINFPKGKTFQDPDLFLEFVRKNINNISCISLDHDLGIFIHDMYGKKEITGFDVSIELVNIVPNTTRIIIHSWNPQGCIRMKNLFTDHNFDDVKIWRFPWWK